ncbi:rhomboid family intramembrane serine protease [Lacibacter sediminis]|uniref:Rhomboid family intramembrane serine protease n=1 Tax=Lacibacter sediminis TaxID=2760713 RepID=A0A7G5XGT3_9BACT|nr:rhomboid family intramembrane serine protease [Lacibacter sediminis]QNA44686.1 rhomboid family intramembrane serine protease [Lacibacter sediminis]
MPQDENGSLTLTYTIIGINVLVFMIMGLQGAGVFDASGLVHLRWGSNYGPLTASGDWWRLITAAFLHFGIIHLAINLYALFFIGTYLEPTLGKLRYITVYLCSAVLAGLASLYWHKEPVNSAGATGALFGMYGVFLALLTTRLIPKKVSRSFLLSVLIFLLYNLFSGVTRGIDLASHTGGLLSGMLIGYLFAFSINKENKQQAAGWVVPAVIILSVFICGWYLQQNKVSAKVRNNVLRDIKNDSYPDVDRFKELYEQFVIVQDDALQVYHHYGDNLSGLPKPILEQFKLKLEKANSIAVKMMNLDVGEEMKGLAATVNRYVELRKKEMELTLRISAQPDIADTLNVERERVKKEIDKELLKLK